MFFFLSQTHVTLPSWHYVNLFPFFPGLARAFFTLGPDFRFYTGLKRSFSILRPALPLFLSIMSTFSILFGSGTLFFSSQTQFLLLYGSEMFFFSPAPPGCFSCCSGTSHFHSINPGFQFVSQFFTHFSTLLHIFFTFIRYLNHCQEEIPIDTISFS